MTVNILYNVVIGDCQERVGLKKFAFQLLMRGEPQQSMLFCRDIQGGFSNNIYKNVKKMNRISL